MYYIKFQIADKNRLSSNQFAGVFDHKLLWDNKFNAVDFFYRDSRQIECKYNIKIVPRKVQFEFMVAISSNNDETLILVTANIYFLLMW